MRHVLLLSLSLLVADQARAVCVVPETPAAFCERGGTTTVVGDAAPLEPGADNLVYVVTVLQVAGAARAGIEAGATITLSPDGEALVFPDHGAPAFFVLDEADNAFVFGLPVVDGRVPISLGSEHTLSIEDANAAALLEDRSACGTEVTGTVEPPFPRLAPSSDCGETNFFGCSSANLAPSSVGLLLLLLLRRRRR